MAIDVTQSPAQLLLELIDYAFDKQSWHGPNLNSALRGLRAKQAASALPKRKSIWQQLLHAAYWKQRALNKLTATTRFPRSPSNWPRMPAPPTERHWRTDLTLLHDIHTKFRAAVAALPPRHLDLKTRRLIEGVALHDIYHAGQICLLRRHLKI